MPTSVGALDRYLRIAVGISLLALVFIGPKTLWGLLGLVPLLTGLTRFCPAYRITGIDTCHLTSNRNHHD